MSLNPIDNVSSGADDSAQLIAMAAARLEVLKGERVMLYAGANIPSERAMAAYAPGLSVYPAMGPSFAKEQPDAGLVSALEIAVENEINALFGARWAETRLPNCTTANLAVFHALASPGDLLLAPAAAHGGHLSQRRGGTPSLAGLRVLELPFDAAECRLDAQGAAQLIRDAKPKLVMLGRSVMITADDIAPIVDSARQVGAKTIFDASHVLGLIAGGVFPNPLTLGVDVMTSSTYKTFAGRPHSVIAGGVAQDRERVAAVIERGLIANCDAGCLPSLLVTLQEARTGGAAYARRICRNTAAMAAALRAQGIPVIAARENQTPTHQLLIPISADHQPAAAIAGLEKRGIMVGTCADPTVSGAFALRVGTQFMTTLGADEVAFADIALRLAMLFKTGTDGRTALRE